MVSRGVKFVDATVGGERVGAPKAGEVNAAVGCNRNTPDLRGPLQGPRGALPEGGFLAGRWVDLDDFPWVILVSAVVVRDIERLDRRVEHSLWSDRDVSHMLVVVT